MIRLPAMKSTLEIFPHNYPDIPSDKGIAIMLRDILKHADSVNSIVYEIQQETCPYYQEALIRLLSDQLDDFYHKKDERFGYYRLNDWIPYWQNKDDEIKELLRQCEQQQKQLKQASIEESSTQIHDTQTENPPTISIQTDRPSTTIKVSQQIKDSIGSFKELLSEIVESTPGRIVNIYIEGLTIQNYNAPVGQAVQEQHVNTLNTK